MKNDISRSRLNWIDYAKGLGIILVVFGHVIKGLITVKLIDPTFFYYSVNFVYSFHMPLFFVLSGYFFLNSFNKRGTWPFVKIKLETIAYPFVIWSIIQTVIEIKLSAYTNNHLHSDVLASCLYIPRSQFWFLYALFFINILNVLFFKITKKWGLLISLMVWIAYYIMPAAVHDFGKDTFEKVFVNLIYFQTGIFLSQYAGLTKKIISNGYLFILNLIIYSCSLYIYFNYPHTAWYNEIFCQLSGCFSVFFICEFLAQKSILKFLEYLGINSLAIYLVHLLAGNGCRIVLSKFLHINNSAILIVSGVLIGLIVPLIVYNIAMKSKYTSWLFAFPAKRKPASL
ncbi:acyltransferase family protein [Mucilaginibacter sp. Mucisp86]|uniref:acyltransferase family protein n=1 Tax=Mucilaginibacter sp. Mucisp86 TaxID=3243060 RepID=UPI0039B54D98